MAYNTKKYITKQLFSEDMKLDSLYEVSITVHTQRASSAKVRRKERVTEEGAGGEWES